MAPGWEERLRFGASRDVRARRAAIVDMTPSILGSGRDLSGTQSGGVLQAWWRSPNRRSETIRFVPRTPPLGSVPGSAFPYLVSVPESFGVTPGKQSGDGIGSLGRARSKLRAGRLPSIVVSIPTAVNRIAVPLASLS